MQEELHGLGCTVELYCPTGNTLISPMTTAVTVDIQFSLLIRRKINHVCWLIIYFTF